MRDEERIELYYKFGVLDWKNEEANARGKLPFIYPLWAVFRDFIDTKIFHVDVKRIP